MRALQKAVYSPSNLGHYGLALESYMHFTSPIRRYPDLVVHQALAQYEAAGVAYGDGNMNLLAESCSGLERRAAQSEWDSVELMALLFLSERRGSVLRGMVSDVKRVVINGNDVEHHPALADPLFPVGSVSEYRRVKLRVKGFHPSAQ